MKADSHRFPTGSIRSVVILAVALAPAACGWAEIPANRVASRGPAEASARPAPGAPRPADGMVTVASGDTVYALSRRYGVPMEGIIDGNGLRPPYTLRIGQRLTLPPGGNTVVASAGGGATEIISTNQPIVISSSQPSGGGIAGQPSSGSGAVSTSRSGVMVSELPPVGGAAPLPSPEASGLPPPASSELPPPLPPGAPPPADAGLSPSSGPSDDGPTSAPPADLVPAEEPEQQAALTPATGSGFMWPLNGDVIAEFGPQEKGRHNDGINIAAPRGSPVRAVESGVVAYAGNELRGFGNLLLVKHEGGWVSAYAHNGSLLVKRGDTVSRGQVIARVGDSGGVSTPQLHFELRKGPRAVDPRTYLRQPVT